MPSGSFVPLAIFAVFNVHVRQGKASVDVVNGHDFGNGVGEARSVDERA